MSVVWAPVVLPVFVAAAGYFLRAKAFRGFLLLAQLAQATLVTHLFLRVRSDGPLEFVVGNWPAGVGIALSADVLSSLLVALVGWLFLVLLVYNRRKLYMDRLFQFLFVTLQGLMIGLFLSRDLFNIYVLLELSTLVVSVLIMFKHDKQTLYDGMVYLMMNLASMSFMLFGVGFVYRTFGTLDLAHLAASIDAVAEPGALVLPFSFVATGIAMKAALFLLFSWLPSAHGAPSAPSIVSAALSGVQVKAGVYLLIRWVDLFAAALPVREFFVVAGFATAIFGVLLALNQRTLKLLLAYSTISQVGLIVIAASIGSDVAYWGSVLHIVNHAIAKSLLFLCAGMVIHIYGTKEIAHIRGVFKRFPMVGVAMGAGVLAIIGTPIFNGSISKYLMQGSLSNDPIYIGMSIVNLGTTITFLRFATVLFGSPAEGVQERPAAAVTQPDPFTAAMVVALAVACLLTGVLAERIIPVLFNLELSVSAALGFEKLLVFAVTLAVGALIARLLRPLEAVREALQRARVSFPTVMIGVTLFFASLGGYLTITAVL